MHLPPTDRAHEPPKLLLHRPIALCGLSLKRAKRPLVILGFEHPQEVAHLSGAALVLTAAVMFTITQNSSGFILIGMSLLFGFTNGFGGFANQATLYRQTRAEEIAVASGLYRTFSYMGAIFSSSFAESSLVVALPR